MIIESALAVGFRNVATSATTRGGCAASLAVTNYRAFWAPDDAAGVHFLQPVLVPKRGDTKARMLKSGIRAVAKDSSSASDPSEVNSKQSYHPFEEIHEFKSEDYEEARLTDAETARTLIEVNSKATLMFSVLINDQVHENIFWPDLPYLTDEHGNIYFEVNDDEDILRILTTDNNFAQVIIGMDTVEMLNEMELGQGDVDFGFEEDSNGEDDDDEEGDEEEEDDGDGDGDYENDWVGALEDEEDGLDSDETLGDWAKLETMRSSHPMYFAKMLAEVAADKPLDCMDQPSAGLVMQGLLRPAFIEERSAIRKHVSDHQSINDTNQVGNVVESNLEDLGINGHGNKSDFKPKDGSVWAEEMEKDESRKIGSSFYKLEMIKIQLVSPQGNQTVVEVKDFLRSRPDAIVHSAAKIISHLKGGGEKTTQALKSLCWRVKGIQVEEVTPIGLDSLGFDLRVCSGTQIQTLRFGFQTRAFSEYSAERQVHELLFPRVPQKPQNRQEAHQKE